MSEKDQDLVHDIFDRIGADLGMIIDRSVHVRECLAERVEARVAGEGLIHVSFRLGLKVDGVDRQGCVLMPLPEAISVSGYLMMMSEEDVVEHRDYDTLDMSMKEAMLEVGNFIAGACDAVLRKTLPEGSTVRSDGCQGVRADVRPALSYDEGEELLVGRAQSSIEGFPDFQMILMLPALAAI